MDNKKAQIILAGMQSNLEISDPKRIAILKGLNSIKINEILVTDIELLKAALREIQTLPSVRDDESSGIAFRALKKHRHNQQGDKDGQ